MDKEKDKKLSAENKDFIGWASKNNLLKVVGIHENVKGRPTTFKVTCEICSKDTELFPTGYFIMNKFQLVNGGIPCGCSKQPKLSTSQYLILASRLATNKFIIKGIIGEQKGTKTKIECKCLLDGWEWIPTLNDTLQGKGCPVCGGCLKKTESEAALLCKNICEREGYIL